MIESLQQWTIHCHLPFEWRMKGWLLCMRNWHFVNVCDSCIHAPNDMVMALHNVPWSYTLSLCSLSHVIFFFLLPTGVIIVSLSFSYCLEALATPSIFSHIGISQSKQWILSDSQRSPEPGASILEFVHFAEKSACCYSLTQKLPKHHVRWRTHTVWALDVVEIVIVIAIII